jgi:N-acetylmuramoyl-L-alanine amidase
MDFDDIEDEESSEDEVLGPKKTFEDERPLDLEDGFGLEDDSEEVLETQSQQPNLDLVPTHQARQSPRVAATRKPRVTLQALLTVIFAAAVVATLLTLWMPSAFTGDALSEQYVGGITAVGQVTKQAEEGITVPLPAEFPDNKVGIIIGNKGRDEGEVCPSGLTEVEINNNVATYLQQALIAMGYEAELLDETDPRLVGYQATILIALHCNTCEYINDNATGFKFAILPSEVKTIDREALTKCLSEHYAKTTGLKYHYQTTSNEIRNYHPFDQLDPLTAAMIFELGYMNLDQDILSNRPQVLADGIAEGLNCFLGSH